MNDSVSKFLIGSAAIFTVVIVISVVMTLQSRGVQSVNSSLDALDSLVIGSDRIEAVDNQRMSGKLVVATALELYGSVPMLVVTEEFPEGFIEIFSMQDPVSKFYVKDTMNFVCSVVRSVHNNPIGIVFVQEGCSVPDVLDFSSEYAEITAYDSSISAKQVELYDDLRTLDDLETRISRASADSEALTKIDLLQYKIDALKKEIEGKRRLLSSMQKGGA